MNFSKSRYIRGMACPKVLWWEEHPVLATVVLDELDENAEQNGQIVETPTLQQLHGEQFAALVKSLFPGLVEVPYSKDLTLEIQRTRELIESGETWIAEASFGARNCFCAVDILAIKNDEVEIYEIKSATKVKEEYMHDLAFQVYVLESAGFKVKKVTLIYVDNTYVKGNLLDAKQMCVFEDMTRVSAGLARGVPKK